MDEGDEGALRLMLQDAEVMRAYEGPLDDEGVRAWLDRQRARYRRDGIGWWAAVLKAGSHAGEVAGQCGLSWQDCAGERVLEVGYMFNRAFWHRGLAVEAARACRDHAFLKLDADEVFSLIRDTNLASQRVACRNGMVPRACFVKRHRGVDMPHIAFSLTRAEWEELRRR